AAYDISEGLKRQAEALSECDPHRMQLLRESRQTAGYLRELTPLVKWFGAEEVIGVTRKAMQIYGGYGVIKDYDVERLLRDSLILPIYEGTSQIQALLATKDVLKAALSKPTVLLGGTVSGSLAAANFSGTLGRLYRSARSEVNAAIRYLLLDLIKQGGIDGALGMMRGKPAIDDEKISYVLLHAERLTAMLAHLHAARLLAEQASKDPSRLSIAERAMRRTLQVARDGAFVIKAGDRSPLETISSWTAVS
ncbi:MAG TPA: acyl-CoA dehydrogenase family protein, partial [Chloroflexota bacterium]|nr:acyl-CoA dehydrogenase family protein [Chloroflexota bacterium]